MERKSFKRGRKKKLKLAILLPDMKLDCRVCTEIQKKERGCTEKSLLPGAWVLDGEEFDRCPLRIVPVKTYEYIRTYNLFTKGYLPNTGGWFDQPRKFIEVMEFIESELAKLQREKIKQF